MYKIHQLLEVSYLVILNCLHTLHHFLLLHAYDRVSEVEIEQV
jgi:hypothetical protein